MKRRFFSLTLVFILAVAALPLNTLPARAEPAPASDEIETVSITVRPPVAGTKSIEIPPQAVLNSAGCSLIQVDWMFGLEIYTTMSLDVVFEEGETYYMLLSLKADEGKTFKKSTFVYGGIDEGAVRVDGCTVEGGTLEYAGSRTLNSDYAKGDFLTLKISVTAVKAADGPEYLLGDVDGDGEIKTGDARLALRRAIDLETYTPESREFKACDINLDGSVKTGDARMILRKAIGFNDPEWGVKQ